MLRILKLGHSIIVVVKNSDCGTRWLWQGLSRSVYMKSLQQYWTVSLEVSAVIIIGLRVVVVIVDHHGIAKASHP